MVSSHALYRDAFASIAILAAMFVGSAAGAQEGGEGGDASIDVSTSITAPVSGENGAHLDVLPDIAIADPARYEPAWYSTDLLTTEVAALGEEATAAQARSGAKSSSTDAVIGLGGVAALFFGIFSSGHSSGLSAHVSPVPEVSSVLSFGTAIGAGLVWTVSLRRRKR